MPKPELEVGVIRIGQLVDLLAEKLGDNKLAVVYNSPGLRWSFREFKKRCDEV